jgi:hypothetical protein
MHAFHTISAMYSEIPTDISVRRPRIPIQILRDFLTPILADATAEVTRNQYIELKYVAWQINVDPTH